MSEARIFAAQFELLPSKRYHHSDSPGYKTVDALDLADKYFSFFICYSVNVSYKQEVNSKQHSLSDQKTATNMDDEIGIGPAPPAASTTGVPTDTSAKDTTVKGHDTEEGDDIHHHVPTAYCSVGFDYTFTGKPRSNIKLVLDEGFPESCDHATLVSDIDRLLSVNGVWEEKTFDRKKERGYAVAETYLQGIFHEEGMSGTYKVDMVGEPWAPGVSSDAKLYHARFVAEAGRQAKGSGPSSAWKSTEGSQKSKS